jgi:hypothetical protein
MPSNKVDHIVNWLCQNFDFQSNVIYQCTCIYGI